MKLNLILFLPFIISSSVGMAQNVDTVKGVLHGDKNEPIIFAAAQLIDNTGKVIQTSISDNQGRFSLGVVDSLSGKIKLHVHPLGYEVYNSDLIPLKSKIVDLRVIAVKASLNQLAEVIIKDDHIHKEGDKLIVPIKTDQFSAGTAAVELLPKLPGVTVLGNNILKLNGRSGVLILIDGRGELLGDKQKEELLATLSADQISKIEIISNPSAKYGANISSIINIVTKKEKSYSNVSSSLNQPLYPDKEHFGSEFLGGDVAANLDFKMGEIKTHIGISSRYTAEYEKDFDTRTIYPDVLSATGAITGKSKSYALAPNANFEYDFNKRSSVNLNIDAYEVPHYEKKSISTYNYSKPSSTSIDSTLIDDQNYTVKNDLSLDIVADWRYVLDTIKKSTFSFDVEYAAYPNSDNQTLLLTNANNNDNQYISNSFDRNSNIITNSGIFSNVIKTKNISAEFGYKFSHLDNHSNQALIDQDDYSSLFRYKENIAALFASTTLTVEKYSIAVGFRGEYLHSLATFADTIFASSTQNYFKLYPNINIQKQYTNDLSASISYSKRVVRPNAGYFNPAVVVNSPINAYKGNLTYKPEYYDRVEQQIIYKQFVSTIWYEHSENQRILVPVSNQSLTYVATNVGGLNSYGITLSQPFSIKSVFTSSNNVDIGYSMKGRDTTQYLKNSWITFDFSSTNEFTINKDTKVSLLLSYDDREYSAYGYTKPIFSSYINIQRLLMKQALSINLSVADLLGTQKLTNIDRYPDQYSSDGSITNNRRITIKALYRFKFGAQYSNNDYSKKNMGEIRPK